jgi:hypothetical protein
VENKFGFIVYFRHQIAQGPVELFSNGGDVTVITNFTVKHRISSLKELEFVVSSQAKKKNKVARTSSTAILSVIWWSGAPAISL